MNEVRCAECETRLLDSDDPVVLCQGCAQDHREMQERAEQEVDELRYNYDEMEMDRDVWANRATEYKDLLEDLVIPKKDQAIPGYVFFDNKQMCCCFCLTHWGISMPEEHDSDCPVRLAQTALGM